ncbi:hypothetical protein M404DRAFT_995260 [Pisolithus tinctorius Marx 270]|uniref:Uncharacterized protein n=1 Tax=Pisolithus tinctorius Marx 270 TaxID=870435 RepID=A0A0C3PAX3_PISTI|nr:hypothetical protein M404DRAFT_995260 [Pisolithus tinctorius Marx 270]
MASRAESSIWELVDACIGVLWSLEDSGLRSDFIDAVPDRTKVVYYVNIGADQSRYRAYVRKICRWTDLFTATCCMKGG